MKLKPNYFYVLLFAVLTQIAFSQENSVPKAVFENSGIPRLEYLKKIKKKRKDNLTANSHKNIFKPDFGN